MTTATSTFSFSNADLASQKVWLNGIKDLILAAGLTQTSDTGQLDVTGMASLVTAGGVIGYWVFKFPDTLQSTAPIFLKVVPANDASAGRPSVSCQVAASTDGAGTLATMQFTSPGTSVGQPSGAFQSALTSYACYTDGTFTMVLGYGLMAVGSTNNCFYGMVVDRARSSTGVALGTGFLCEGASPSTGAVSSRSMYGAASPAVSANMPSLIPSQTAVSSSDGANVNVFRHYMMVPGVKPALGVLTYFSAEFGALSPFTATVLGSSHTYLPMGLSMTNWSAAGAATHCGAIRWE